MTKQPARPGLYRTLTNQLDRAARHNRQGSYRTKERYYKAMKRFCRYLADEYHLQKLSNISAKHLVAYVRKLQAEGKSPGTIKTELSGIRFFYDKLDGVKRPLPDNDHLDVKLERRRFGGVDRTWSPREFARFVQTCRDSGHGDYAAIATLTYYSGLRIHECFRLDTAAAEAALRTGLLTVKGKGGKVRSVPIGPAVRAELEKMLAVTPRGCKLFVKDGEATHLAINRLQQYICAVRPAVQDPDSARPMTHHGLRHSYAARTYQAQLDNGGSSLDARYHVSRLLGHKRPDVTDVYTCSVRRKERPDEK